MATDSIWVAKGDLAVGTGAGAASRLAVGANGTVLIADSTQATGVRWGTVAGSGDVTAAASFGTDNRLVRSDGTGKGVQSSGITVSDTNAMTGVASVNGLIISTTTGTLTLANGKTLTASNTLTLAGTDGSTLNIGGGGTLGTAAFMAATSFAGSGNNSNITNLTGLTGSVSWPGGVRQTFSPGGFDAGLNVGSTSGTPLSLLEGDIYYELTAGIYRGKTSAGVAQFATIDTLGVLAAPTFSGLTQFLGTQSLTNGALYFYNSTNSNFTRILPGAGGNNTLTLPTAPGTLALTSDLSAYLPLAGGALTGAVTQTLTALGATSVAGVTQANSTAAANNAQQYSPVILWEGQAWNPTAGASQPVQFNMGVQPMQGNPVLANLIVQSRMNSGSWVTALTLGNTGNLTVTGSLTAGAGGGIGWQGRTMATSSANGVLTLTNSSFNNFDRLNFGNNTASFPALKRVGATLAVRVGDDSADAAITAAAGVFSGPVTLPSYTVATVPSPGTFPRAQIYVSDESGGATPAFSDGTNWRRYADRAIVS